jgi:hypothetical protein
MLQWAFSKIDTVRQSVGCDPNNFDKLPFESDEALQCVCEARTDENKRVPVIQADAPDFTRYWCPGNIFYGRKFHNETGKPLSFRQMLQFDYVVENKTEQIERKKADQMQNNFGYQCSSHYFGRDPQEG